MVMDVIWHQLCVDMIRGSVISVEMFFFWRGRFIKISKILYKIIEMKTKENAV